MLQRCTGNEKADDNVPHFKTVEELANSNTDKFLIGGTRRVNGLHVFERSESHLIHHQRPFTPGDILIRDKVYCGETKKQTRLFRKPKYITEKFLMCRDDADREILLPFEQKGIFYQVSERCGKPNHNVMQISDIVARNIPPRIVKLVFGRFPVTPCFFTGLMKVDTARLESSIIASTIINTKNILIEIPMTAGMHFKIVNLTEELKNNRCYKNALNLCMERATTYMRNIKLCYEFPCKTGENIQMIKKESDMDLISSDEGNDECIPPNVLKNQSKKSSSVKRRFRKMKSLEQNNNTLAQNKKKSCFNRGSSKNNQSKQTLYDLSDHSPREAINKRFQGDVHTRFSNEVESENNQYIRSVRSLSTGRISFCFGNNYLSVPFFATYMSSLDEIKNRKRSNADETAILASNEELKETFPAPMQCMNMGPYVNTRDGSTNELNIQSVNNRRGSDVIYNANFGNYFNTPEEGVQKAEVNSDTTECNSTVMPTDSYEQELLHETNKILPKVDDDDYVPVAHQRRPSSKAPDFAPPPVPTSVIASNSRDPIFSTNDTNESGNQDPRLSRDSLEQLTYDIPKQSESNYSAENISPDELKARRPSTFTFTEGLCMLPSTDAFSFPSVNEFGGMNEDSPIYENIQALQEFMTKMENLEIDNSDIKAITQINELEAMVENQTMNETGVEYKNGVEKQNENNFIKDIKNKNTEEKGTEYLENNIKAVAAESPEERLDMTNLFWKENVLLDETGKKLKKTLSLESSSRKVSKQNSLTERQKTTDDLTVDEFIAHLDQIGIRDNSLNRVKELEINVKVLSSVAHDDESLKEYLPNISLIDLQKISMFLRGWRPYEET